jgi:tetratricopeptide (TPR) repeat protein
LGPAAVSEAIAELRALLGEVSTAEALYVATHLGWLEAQAGRFEEARRLRRQSRQIADDLGQSLQRAAHAMFDGWIELLAGDPVAAEAAVRPGYEALERMGEKSFLSTTAGVLADALYRQGRYDEAEREADVCREAAAADDVASQIEWRWVRAKVLVRRGQLEEAEPLAREAVELAEETDFLFFRGQVLEDYAEVLRLADRADEAASYLEQAITLYERKGVVPAIERTRALLGR